MGIRTARRIPHFFSLVVGATATASLLLLALVGNGQPVLQQGFEGRDPVWVAGAADAKYKELAHKIIDDPAAHGGQRSEYLQLQVEQGTFIHYTYDVGRAPVTDDLTVGVWVKASRPNLRVLCRVVLPRERDPQHLDQVLTVVVPGDAYELVGRWQQLTLRQPVKGLRQQQQLLQKSLNREVNTTDAYVDRVILNVYGGPGQSDVWTDDLEVGPILDTRPVGPPTAQPPARLASRPHRASEVKLTGNNLLIGDKKFFMRAIRHNGTPLKTLRDAGFNTVWVDETTPPDLVDHAIELGFWIVPSLTPPEQPEGASPAQVTALNESFGRKVGQFINLDAVLAWDLGSNLQQEQYQKVSRTAGAFRQADPMRPLAADVWDGYLSYTRGLDPLMLGVHRWPLMTTLDLAGYKDWLVGRRRLATPDTFCWTWVQTHLPDWYSNLVYGQSGAQGFNEPVGPQPEQIRLMTYLAVGSGYRGVGFWSDRFLADSHTGRDRLLALALLNQELEMLEPLLVGAEEPKWIDTGLPEVKAAVIRSEKAILVLPVWIGKGSQYVPGQSAVAKLAVIVPQVPPNMQPWEVSPGCVRSLPDYKRVTGGIFLTIPEFSLTSAVVFTSDPGNPTGLVARFQEQQRRMSKVASQWANDQAKEEIAKVEHVYEELDKGGHPLPEGKHLLERAHTYLDSSEKLRINGDYGEAYLEAQRALRPVRVLMRAEWDLAVKDLGTPVASPFALSYFTLPRHYEFWQDVQQRRAANNVLPDGDFEAAGDKAPDGWLMEEVPSLDDVVVSAKRVKDDPKVGKQCLVLEIKVKDGARAPLVLERSYVAIHSPAVRLQPGSLVKISGWVKIPDAIGATTDGALLFDSAGGEPLALRLTAATGTTTPATATTPAKTTPAVWKQYTVYRKVPASGTINVTMALQGLGKVYFDDLRIEPLAAR